jgi:SNF2 family DNA or RNA helicase
VVEDSIEAKILQLQDKKLAMTQAALATDPDSALGKLTEEVSSLATGVSSQELITILFQDMQFLFRL